MVKNHPSYADMVYGPHLKSGFDATWSIGSEAFANVDRHTKLAHVKIKKYVQEAYEIDMTKTGCKNALKRALEIGASYKMTATGLQHLQGARSSSETDPKKRKERMVKKPAVKKSTTRTKTGGAAASKKMMTGRVKAGALAASKKKTTNGTTTKMNGSAMIKVKTQVKTSEDAEAKNKLTTTSKVPAEGPLSSDERPPADGEEPQTETEPEEDEDGELPNPHVGGLEARVAVGGKDEEQVTPEKNKINGRGSGGLDVGQGPGAPRKRSAHGGD
ncbi:BZ3500_MvSof-1268-A1-R1_Chr3-3g06604 [Microbotryum saponariae]|uniref:BZ3500_MvSof-1268-A1-R1_Chr3-3g06604 protein n=1 Tax=Microbotryum saponariae TaxID=289078 RepID=A0A2X0LGX0_9BASI|nr:BZ3500_MvSof-1268-A1-R1_Chr3-3g06604 [Microbotryum saponariae]SDA04571.1 BZ3501_MvSof-1269-A2-R1_Chr3-2g06291 [Microbotryum saponariae]